MKTIFKIIIVSVLLFSFTNSNPAYNIEFEKGNYIPGEKLEYRLHYGFVTAGRAIISVENGYHLVQDKPCYKARVSGVFNLGFRIRDTWESFIDTNTFKPLKAFRNIEEGRYKLMEDVIFDTENNMARVMRKHPDKPKEESTYKIPDNVHDIVSGFYELRRINFNKLKIGDTITLKAFFDKQNYNFKVRYMGKGKLNIDAGKFNAIKLVPVMPKNGLFDGEESIKCWISDDKNKIPLMAEAEMFVGSVQLELTSYKGLKNPANVIK